MAPQTSIPPAANILGTIGTVCWCVQLIPQIWHNWRLKKTDGLPGLMIMLWASCAVPFGIYSVVQNFNIPIQVQPQCFGLLCLVCWGQTLVYHNGWRTWTASLITIILAVGFGVVEAILILTLRGPYSRGVSWPLTMIGVIASVILAAGLIPPYYELAKRGGRVIGINFIFLTIDWFGAFFSLAALVAQNTFDYLGGMLYIVCLFLELGIFASQFVWLYRTRHIRHAAKKAGKTYDEYMAATSDPSRPDTAGTTDIVDIIPRASFETIATLEKCKNKSDITRAGPSLDLPDLHNIDLEKGTRGAGIAAGESAGRA